MANFKFELVSPERLLISEDASEVQVPGSEGDFTVLSGHSPVLSTLRPGVLNVKLAEGKARRIYVKGGFAEADPASLTILAQQAVDLAELDKDWVATELASAEQELAAATGDDEKRNAYSAVAELKQLAIG